MMNYPVRQDSCFVRAFIGVLTVALRLVILLRVCSFSKQECCFGIENRKIYGNNTIRYGYRY